MKRRRYWLNLSLFGLLLAASGLGFGVVKLAFDGAQNYVHPPRSSRTLGDNPNAWGIEFQDVILRTRDAIDLAAWYTPSQNGAVVLVAHGYRDKRSSQMHALFAQHDYGVVSWDFRAHGDSGGELCTMSYLEALDVEAALDFALEHTAATRIGGWGGSMGAASMIRAAASRPEIGAVVADSSFTILEEELDVIVNVGIMRDLVQFFAEQEAELEIELVRPVDMVAQISPRPILLIQGAVDVVVPIDSAQRLYNAAGEPRMLWMVPEAGHLESLSVSPDEYKSRVITFFDNSLTISH